MGKLFGPTPDRWQSHANSVGSGTLRFWQGRSDMGNQKTIKAWVLALAGGALIILSIFTSELLVMFEESELSKIEALLNEDRLRSNEMKELKRYAELMDRVSQIVNSIDDDHIDSADARYKIKIIDEYLVSMHLLDAAVSADENVLGDFFNYAESILERGLEGDAEALDELRSFQFAMKERYITHWESIERRIFERQMTISSHEYQIQMYRSGSAVLQLLGLVLILIKDVPTRRIVE
jgi:hypothetical protein